MIKIEKIIQEILKCQKNTFRITRMLEFYYIFVATLHYKCIVHCNVAMKYFCVKSCVTCNLVATLLKYFVLYVINAVQKCFTKDDFSKKKVTIKMNI